MGSNGSKNNKKNVQSDNSTEFDTSQGRYNEKSGGGAVVVLSRKGSMFIDEDGDLAHEFYVEVPPPKKGCKATMKRILHNLIPQGDVAYKFPRLHVDFPIIIYHV
ncbi:tumor suppressor candidate 2 [Anabrus simplex]|uniref:tumor suppressor candidate 2 n=1 Tax=Anabrus simplex TaxID=316456 RepID=UPI0035A28659